MSNQLQLGLVWAILLTSAATADAQPPAAALPPVFVAEVVQRGIAENQSFVGTVMPLRKSTVGSALDGRVVEFPVNAGDWVKKGQPLAQLLTQTLEIEIAAAGAELELRKQELAELENGTRPEEIAQAKAAMEGAKALVEYSQAKYRRSQTLFDQGRAVTQDQLQADLSTVVQAEQAFAEASATYDLAVLGPRKERIAQAAAKVQMQTEAVARLKDQLAKHTIVAPFDGYVSAEHTEVGQWLAKAEPVAEVVDIHQVEVEVMAMEAYIARLRAGQKAEVHVEAHPDRSFTGEVTHIVPQADLRSRSFPVRVRLENEPQPDGTMLLKPGMFARVSLPAEQKTGSLLVPKDALVLGGRKPLVFIVDPDPANPTHGKVRPVEVSLGVASGSLIEVSGKLRAGEKVVVEGNERLRPQAKVRIDERPDSAEPRGAGRGE